VSRRAPVRIVAVDPGLTGAIAFMTLHFDGPRGGKPRLALDMLADMPTYRMPRDDKRSIDLKALDFLLGCANPDGPGADPVDCVIEGVGAAPGQGVSSMFKFGFVTGAVFGVAAAHGMSIHTLRPQEWMRLAGKPSDEDGRAHAAKLWPCKAGMFVRVKDHGRSDAALLGLAFAAQRLGARPATTASCEPALAHNA
jgi:crossover junction endodeoxyribonuclease RuvC